MSHVYIVYKIINKINNKFYIGWHKTTNINDDYFGSGLCIKAAIKKYGIECFEKTILHVFRNKFEAVKKEKELVTEKLIKDPMCYNISVGGHGGFHHIRSQNKHKSNKGKKIIHHKTIQKTTRVFLNDLPKYLELGWELGFLPESLQKMSQSGKKRIQSKEHRLKNSNTKINTSIMEHIQTKQRKFVKKHLIKEYLKNGWKLFDSKKNERNKIYIHNLKLNSFLLINPKDLNKYEKEGWKKGRLPKKTCLKQ